MKFDFEEALSYYRKQGAPTDQPALISLLKEVQDAEGGVVSKAALAKIAEVYQIRESYLNAVIRRIPGLRVSDKHELEICCGPNCPKKKDLTSFVEKTYGKNPENFTLKYG